MINGDVFISKEQIAARIEEMARDISEDYQGKELLVICILKGAFIFCADLVRKLNIPVDIEFMSVGSYEGTESTGEVKINLDLKADIKNRDILILEDIVDTGITMNALLNILEKRGPKSIKLASLFFKPARIRKCVNVDYLGFEIEDKFIVGYGLDYNGAYRELPDVQVFK